MRLQTLQQKLLPKSLDELIMPASQLIVCLHQALHHVPFLGLPWNGEPLIKHVPVGVVPNLSCLMSYEKNDENLDDLFIVGSSVCRDENFNPLSQLPNVEKEIEEIEALWRESGANTFGYRGSEATRRIIVDPVIKEQLQSSRLLYFAVHGSDVAEGDVANHPMEAKLYLYDGPVDGLELSGLKLKAELVVLAACYTGKRATSARGLARLPTDTIYGLQAAFHQGGVKSMIGALWPANDNTTPTIMKLLMRNLRDGERPNFALQKALCEYLETASPIEKEVGFWACFQFIGFNGSTFGLGSKKVR